MLRRNPELVRQRIQRSGLTPEQIRQRLRAAGYSPTLLDPYLGAAPEGVAAAQVNEDLLRAMASLGVMPLRAEGPEQVSVQAGPEAGPPAAAKPARGFRLPRNHREKV